MCKNNWLETEDLPQWTKKVIGKIWSQVLEHVEARNFFIKNIMWRSTDIHGHVVGETEEVGAITLTCVCEQCKLFPVEDFLWVGVHTHHGRETKEEQHEWLVAQSLRADVRLEKAESSAHIGDWRHSK